MGTPSAADVIKSGVYRIDLGAGWFYLGSACNLKKREREHRRGLERNTHGNKIMQNVFNKYGAFAFTVLGIYPVNAILKREQDLLDAHSGDPKCTNIALVAGSPMAGRKTSDATKAKISTAKRGKKRPPFSPEWRAAISAANTGKKRTPEHCATLSAALTGRKLSPEHCAAISSAAIGRKMPPFTPEHRSALSAWQIGIKKPPCTPEHRAALSAAGMGRKTSDATKAKISVANRGKKKPPCSPEHRAALSAAGMGRKHSDATKAKMSASATAWRAQRREAAAAAL